jgi:uncharacterized protein
VQWTPGDRSNVDDERGRSGFGGFGIGGGTGLGVGGVLVLLVLSWATGTNFFSFFDSGSPAPAETTGTVGQVASSPAEEQQVDFVDAVMKDVQATWRSLLGERYDATRVVLFRDTIDSGCGAAQSATGPFYCPQDSRVYLDLGFFDELKKLGAPGDFARAYVIAHEVGHHVQRLTGIDARFREAGRDQPRSRNAMSVQIELQADCFAGVWGHAASQPGRAAKGEVEIDKADVEQGLQAAASIGDDRLQRMSTGHVAPDQFTHGSSAQRVDAFRRGLASGSPEACGSTNTTTH